MLVAVALFWRMGFALNVWPTAFSEIATTAGAGTTEPSGLRFGLDAEAYTVLPIFCMSSRPPPWRSGVAGVYSVWKVPGRVMTGRVGFAASFDLGPIVALS